MTKKGKPNIDWGQINRKSEQQFKEYERLQLEFGKKLLAYFNLLKVNIDKFNKLSKEEIFTLKQFLTDYYLYTNEISRNLKDTDFSVANKNVDKKIRKFLSLNLIENVDNSSIFKIYNKLPRPGAKYYKLTNVGLLCILKEIEEYDVGDTVAEIRSKNKMFKTYSDDPLFQIFIYPLINKELLASINSRIILWIFTKYLKQVCTEINKELRTCIEFQKNGMILEPGIKWNYNLKDKKEKWKDLVDRLLDNIILVPLNDHRAIKSEKFTDNPHIYTESISFYYGDIKYSVELDKQNESAKLLLNDEEYFKHFDVEKGNKEYCKKYQELAVKKTRDCYILNRVSKDEDYYLYSLSSRFNALTRSLNIKLGFDILEFFVKSDLIDYFVETDEKVKEEYHEVIKLAKDEKIKNIVDELTNDFKSRYNEFKRKSNE